MAEISYEVVRYDETNFIFVTGQTASVLPHSHRELELGLVLKGQPRLRVGEADFLLRPGSLWVVNPFESHALRSRSIRTPYCYVALQFSLSFFRAYFPQAEHVRFAAADLSDATVGADAREQLRGLLLGAARDYFGETPFYALRCASRINELMALLLERVPHAVLSDQDLREANQRAARLRRVTDYIEEHMGEKVLLGDIARQEGLSLAYLSHLFSAEMGMPFQSYLTGLRCRRAAALLMQTDQSPTDISLSCGFSALKYMTRGLQERYGCTPKELRETGLGEDLARRHEDDRSASRGGSRTPHTRAEALRFLERAAEIQESN